VQLAAETISMSPDQLSIMWRKSERPSRHAERRRRRGSAVDGPSWSNASVPGRL